MSYAYKSPVDRNQLSVLTCVCVKLHTVGISGNDGVIGSVDRSTQSLHLNT
jgi:hypothetical protein